MRATDELRKMLDEADEYYKTSGNRTWWGRPVDMQTGKPINVFHYQAQPMGEDRLFVELQLVTPAQAIAATLGNQYDCDHPEWVEWVDSLNHREVKSIRDAVEKLMYESITLGGSMGPNDNIEDGWNEGTELTKAYIDGWVETFATLGDADERNFKLFEAAKKWMAKAAHFEAENSKLRELVRDAWGSGHPDKSCGDCEIRDECHDDMERLSRDGMLRFSRCLFELRIEDRMRELGIEVPE